MSAPDIIETVSVAARNHGTVTVSVRTSQGLEVTREVEPYSIFLRERQPTLYCYDLADQRVVALHVADLLGAAATGRPFQPRYDIEL